MAVLDIDSGSGRVKRPRLYQGSTEGRVTATSSSTPTAAPPYQAPAPVAPAPQQQQQSSFSGLNQGAILQYLQNLGKPSTAALQGGFQNMLSQGLLPSGSFLEDKNTADEIYVPGYGWIDTMVGADTGNPSAWQFSLSGGPGHFFSDPMGMWFGQQIEDVMGQLRQPRELSPELADAYGLLRGWATNPGRGGGGPDLGRLREATTKRVTELQAEPFSQTEEAGQRVKAFDNLERSRQVAIQQTVERLAQMGHAPSSGTTQAALNQINASFDGLRAQNENQLLLHTTGERQRRRSEAMSLEQALAEAEQAAAGLNTQAALGAGSQGVGASQALASLAQFMDAQRDPMARLMAMLQAAGLMSNYTQQQFDNAAGQVG